MCMKEQNDKLIEIIIERCQKVNTLPVLFDLYYFIASVSFNLEMHSSFKL